MATHKSSSATRHYLLLIFFAAISMTYYIAGALALHQEFYHAGRYVRAPFDTGGDERTITSLEKEGQAAGLVEGDKLLRIAGAPYTGYLQIHDLIHRSSVGQIWEAEVQEPSGRERKVQIRLAPREGPDFSVIGFLTFLTPVLAIPLLGLVVGYWLVAARPQDLNAWLALLLLSFPETAFGNLDWTFWPGHWFLFLGCWNV